MKVLELTQRFSPAIGGVENHVMNLAYGLSRAGVTTEVLTTDLRRDVPFRRLDGVLPSFPFPIERFRALKAFEAPHGLGIVAPSMLWGVLSRSPDLIHAHAYGYFPTYVGALAKMIRRVPLVMTPHSDAGRPTLTKRVLDHVAPVLTLHHARRIIAVTVSEANHLAKLGVPPERIVVIPNGVDPEEFAGEACEPPSGGPIALLFVGRCYLAQKGLDTLVRAMALLPRSLKAHLRIVGEDWGGAAPTRALAEALGIGRQVTVEGPLARKDLLRAYASSQVFVLPSLFEPFGIVLLEAMAAGLPVVASRVGGIPEVVEDERTGLLVEPGNARDLSGALERLLRDEALRRRLGERGRSRARLYSWSAIVPKIHRVYEETIAEGAA